MPDDTCCIEGCGKPRDRKKASCKCVTHRCLSSKRTCSFPGCPKPHNARGWCKEHYDRYLRHGDPSVVIARPDNGWLHPEGYRKRSRHGHPLADANGNVFEQRLMLYEKIGPGAHLCHWCDTLVDWSKSWPRDPDALVADHLDHNRLNNDRANLVPSCQLCNYKRTKNQQVKAAKRGTTTQRGYGTEHVKLRALLLPLAIDRPCPRCGELMLKGQALDLGHVVGDRMRYSGIEHARCNRATATKSK